VSPAPFRPVEILTVLIDHGVRFVIIGGFAASLRGWPGITQDLDVCYDRSQDNLERLAAASRELGSTLRVARETEPVPFQLDARSLRNGDSFTFETKFGDFDIVGTPSGTAGFADLDTDASTLDVGMGTIARVASIDDLIRMKRASFRLKDRSHLEDLAALREEIEAAREAGEDPHQG
jgi:hypothetical protein